MGVHSETWIACVATGGNAADTPLVRGADVSPWTMRWGAQPRGAPVRPSVRRASQRMMSVPKGVRNRRCRCAAASVAAAGATWHRPERALRTLRARQAAVQHTHSGGATSHPPLQQQTRHPCGRSSAPHSKTVTRELSWNVLDPCCDIDHLALNKYINQVMSRAVTTLCVQGKLWHGAVTLVVKPQAVRGAQATEMGPAEARATHWPLQWWRPRRGGTWHLAWRADSGLAPSRAAVARGAGAPGAAAVEHRGGEERDGSRLRT